jgi:hypothetical protein
MNEQHYPADEDQRINGSTGGCSPFANTTRQHSMAVQSFDRILLNGLIQPIQQPERVVGLTLAEGVVGKARHPDDGGSAERLLDAHPTT